MQDEITRAKDLQLQTVDAMQRLEIEKSALHLHELKQASERPDFWQDNLSAQMVMKEITKVESRISPWLSLIKSIDESLEMLELHDDSMRAELTAQLDDLE